MTSLIVSPNDRATLGATPPVNPDVINAALAALRTRSIALNTRYGLPGRPAPAGGGGSGGTGGDTTVPWWQNAASDADIQKQADTQVDASIAAQSSPIEAARARAAAAAIADEKALRGIGEAGQSFLAGIGGRMQGGYDRAAQETAGLASGFSTDTANRIKAAQDANAQFVNDQAKGADQQQTVDPNALHDTLYGLGGFVPGSSLEAQGAAANQWGEGLAGIDTIDTKNKVEGRQATAATDDKQYEQQLIDLAAKRPDLRNQIVDELYKREVDRFNANLQQQQEKESERHNKVSEEQNQSQLNISDRAQTLYEKQYGEKVKHDRATEALSAAKLQLSNAKYQTQLNNDLQKGKQIDAAASRVKGTIVYKDGTVTNIPIAKTSSSVSASVKSYRSAVTEAKTLRGKPVTNPTPLPGVAPGKYIAAPGAQGVFPATANYPATTNDPKKAKSDAKYSFVEAQAYLMDSHGLSRANARKALIAAGWKPDGQRPKK